MLLKGNCLETLKTLPDNSIDSVVTDPPYEYGFMGKSWDNSGIAYNQDLWRECLRVLKPGGHLLAFSGSRTYHRMTVAIEDAGFEIRDQIMWLYGSGFPKSYNVAKGIEGTLLNGSASWNDFHKLNGEIREVKGATGNLTAANAEHGNRPTNYQSHGSLDLEPTTDEAKKWMGWGTALKPAHEPICVARKPLTGTVASNVLEWGTGALNIDATRVGTSGENFDNLKGRPIAKLSTRRDGETDEEYNARILESPEQQKALAKLKQLGRWPANVIHDGSEEVLAGFPNDAGRFFYCAKASKSERNAGLEGLPEQMLTGRDEGQDAMQVPYKTRSKVTANIHPTVKPLALMRYLVKMVTPSGGTVLDPFLGSGSTAVAAILEGFEWVGCEMTEDYWHIIEARVDWAHKQALEAKQERLF